MLCRFEKAALLESFRQEMQIAVVALHGLSSHRGRTGLVMGTSVGWNTASQRSAQVNSQLRRCAVAALLALVIVYAVLCGFRTITDADTGWQLASGRYILQHREIPAGDVFSYTARGQQWIYPAGAEVLLYLAYLAGGFAALSWINALACAATVGVACWAEAGIASAVLAILAIPKIAYRTAPRADLFSSLLFATLLAILWRHHRGRKTPLWLLPLIFVVWANTHLGFIAGFALLGGYVALELGEFLLSERRAAARARLRSAIPWLITAVPVTLLNPWGWNVYRAIIRQGRAMDSQQNVLAEWRHVPLTPATLDQALHLRNPESSYFWLLALAIIAAVIALRRRHFGAAVLLLGSAYMSVQHIRFQALFVIIVVVVAGPLFAGLFAPPEPVQVVVQKSRAQRRQQDSQKQRARLPSLGAYAGGCTIAALVIAVALLGTRCYDLVTQHAYIAAGDVNLFGGGFSSYYPQRAADFIRREKLPSNIFNEYNLGGYLSFELGPQYLDYIDPRAIPFGDLMAKQRDLMMKSPDSAAWQEEADARGINTAIFSLARYWGLPNTILRQLCASTAWKPVYLDDAAIVLVRNRPENQPWLSRFALDCQQVKFESPPAIASASSSRGRAELFNYYANAGSILFKLGRKSEAEAALQRAIQMFPAEPFLHQILGQLYQSSGNLPDAEREYLTSARLKPVEATWYTLAMLYTSQQRYGKAVNAFAQAAQLSVHPSQYFISMGTLYVAMQQPQRALNAFDAAADSSGYEPPEMKADIDSQVAAGRARAWNAMSSPSARP